MEPAHLLAALRSPAAYPYAVDDIQIWQTHISMVFLAGPFAYKLKKPVVFSFLDFSTLERRRHFCEEEVRLNRRLAPDVYLGVVPVTQTNGHVQLEGTGEIIEWAVKMRRLPEAATLQRRLRRGAVEPMLIETLARRIASFHAKAESRYGVGGYPDVTRNLLDIYRQSEPQVETTVHRIVFDRLRGLTEQELERWQLVIEERARRGMVRDTHGDLHLDHVYYFPEREPPADLVIVDCIEFNERFRLLDPIADMAFPVMDFKFYGRRDLARLFAESYFQTTGDEQGRVLLPLYTAYRATVRGSVEGLKLAEPEITDSDRMATLTSARAHWLLALGELEEPGRRPGLVLVSGLPGTGKSTLARQLAERASFTVLRSDVLRKELAGLPIQAPTPAALRDALYHADMTERTYAECLRRAETLLFQGQRVLIDASFRAEKHRRLFLEAALRWGVPVRILILRTDGEVVRQRLENRRHDASDADWKVFTQLAASWEEPSPATRCVVRDIPGDGRPEEVLALALEALADWSE